MNFNMCSYFLPQFIGFNKFDTKGLINCFIFDIEDKEPFEHIYILMESDSTLLDIHPYTVSKREVTEGNLYKIKISSRFIDDIRLFAEGKYSKMSEDAKKLIVENCGIYPEKSLGYTVLYKSPKRKAFLEELIGQELPQDAEYMSVLDLKKEAYGY